MAIIGRQHPADIVIADPQVSSQHAEIRALGGGRYLLTDLGSRNGTTVNGRKITSAEVGLGDEIRLGGIRFDLRAYQGTLDPGPRKPPAPASAAQQRPRRQAPAFALVLIGVAVLLLAVAGGLVATQQTITQRCEVCGREIFREKVFFFQAEEARRRAAAHRWCRVCGDEPVTVEHISRCEYCNKVIAVRHETRPRREQPQGSDTRAGFCSDQCRMLHTGREIYREGKSVVKGAASALGEAAAKAAEELDRLLKK